MIICPGYGLAVAQGQGKLFDFVKLLQAAGVGVKFAIHPVAGRMPGQMDVLLAEAGIPYDLIVQLADVNDEFETTDVALVIGANDTVNPSARTDKSSPIFGMPILNADQAKRCYVIKRGDGKGYAGIVNPLFYADNTFMVYGDAAAVCVSMTEAVRGLGPRPPPPEPVNRSQPMKKMHVAMVEQFKKPLVLREWDIPTPGPGQILVKTEACGVCHTDIHAAAGDWPVRPTLPFIPGHEGIGRVSAVGVPGMTTMQPVSSITVPAGGKAVLAPGGFHIMLIGLRHDLKAGEAVPLRLHFAKAGWQAATARERILNVGTSSRAAG